MSLEIEKYERTPFVVEAVQITLDNMEAVAEWCGGEIKRQVRKRSQIVQYIEVDVTNPMTERQGKGFVGSWLLKTKSGFKVYTERAFNSCFKKVKMGVTAEELLGENYNRVKAGEWTDDMLPVAPQEDMLSFIASKE